MDSLQSQAGAREWQHPFLLLLGTWGQPEGQHCSHHEQPRVGEGAAWTPSEAAGDASICLARCQPALC